VNACRAVPRTDQRGKQDVRVENDPHVISAGSPYLSADASPFCCIGFAATGRTSLGANLADGVVDQRLQPSWIGFAETLAHTRRGSVKDPPANGLLDEFRKVALALAGLRQLGPQGCVGLFRDLHRPARRFVHGQHL
jgi:hypothetical protein